VGDFQTRSQTATARIVLPRPLKAGAIGLASAAAVFLGAFAFGARTPGAWDGWADLVCALLSTATIVFVLAHKTVDRRASRWPILLTLGGLALSQFILALEQLVYDSHETVGPVLIGRLVQGTGVVWYIVQQLGAMPRKNAFVHLVDSGVVAVGLAIVHWELIVLPLRDETTMSLTDQLGTIVPIGIDLLLFCILVLVVIVNWSPAGLSLAASVGMFFISDSVINVAAHYPSALTVSVVTPARVLGVVLLGMALGLPSGDRFVVPRQSKARLLLVSTAAFTGFAIVILKYLVDGDQATGVTILLASASVVLRLLSRTADHLLALSWSERMTGVVTALHRSEEELRRLIDDVPDAIIVLGRDGRLRDANESALRLTNRSRDELLGQYMVDIFPEDERARLLELWRGMKKGTLTTMPVYRFDRPDGMRFMIEAGAVLPIRDPDRVVISMRDVTERLAESARSEEARQRFRGAFHDAPIGMALLSYGAGQFIDANKALAAILGGSREDVLTRNLKDFTAPMDWQRDDRRAKRLHEGATELEMRQERVLRRFDGSTVWVRSWASLIESGPDDLVLVHIEDITEQRNSAQQLEWAATHDALTGLPNRFSFLERLSTHLVGAEPGSVAVMFIDLDNFKVVNDSLGHEIGDQLLITLAERLRAVVRDRDLLGRFGGDEFIVMLSDVGGADDPIEVAERLRAEIVKPMILNGSELHITASIGITLNGVEGTETGDLLRDADAAMYRAKSRGRDCVEVFSHDSLVANILTLRTTNELRKGLDRGEIIPYYQPIVELSSGRLAGFEVLARWRHPERGLLGPEQFLPMAEEMGLIGDIGSLMLRTSLAQLGHWHNSSQRYADLSMSVNVSVRQLMNTQFVDIVAEALAESGVAAGALWLEITETALMADAKLAAVALRSLRNLGLHLAIDDFGTGYSSLTYLKRFPIEAIKVDRSFVSGLGFDAEDSSIVEAVVKLGHSLGLTVVAEGVETPLQLSRLREMGCARGQGYLFGRPRPAELVETEYSLR